MIYCYDYPLQKWKISCFRHEEFSFGKTNEFAGEDILGEELQKSEIEKPTAPNRNLISLVAKVELLLYFSNWKLIYFGLNLCIIV